MGMAAGSAMTIHSRQRNTHAGSRLEYCSTSSTPMGSTPKAVAALYSSTSPFDRADRKTLLTLRSRFSKTVKPPQEIRHFQKHKAFINALLRKGVNLSRQTQAAGFTSCISLGKTVSLTAEMRMAFSSLEGPQLESGLASKQQRMGNVGVVSMHESNERLADNGVRYRLRLFVQHPG